MASSFLITGALVLGGEPTDLLLADGVIAAVGADAARSRPVAVATRLTPTDSSPCRAWSTSIPTCANRVAKTPRPSASGSAAAAVGGFTAVHAMANTDPVADTAGVVEQVWHLGRRAGLCDVHPVGAVTVGLGGSRARRARRHG